jgi:NAD+ kinase
MAEPGLHRVALVVHPARPIDDALATVRRWTEENGLELVQLVGSDDTARRVAPPGTVRVSDVVLAIGGDGTMLKALHAAAATGTPVLGVACGSLGVLSAVTESEIAAALERFRAGDWTPRPLAALAVASDSREDWALNDFVAFRRGSTQLGCSVTVGDEIYVRMAGDGVIVATPLGSSAYSMAAGGPVLAAGSEAFVCTPLAMHGGNAPPLVVPASAAVTIEVFPGYSGFDVEIDGARRPAEDRRFRITMHDDKARLVTFAPGGRGLDGLRRRGIVADSPRILARDDRAARPVPGPSER